MRALAAAVLAALVRLWVRTLRVVVESAVDPGAPGGRVLAFFHGQQMALLAAPRPRRAAVLVSLSRDGELQASVMRGFGLEVVRGSSSRGARRGLLRLVRLLRHGRAVAFAVDGPRGPAGVAKGGAAFAARVAGAELLPVATAMRRGITLRRAWDAFEVPAPFARVAVVIGPPLDASEASSVPARLDAAIAAARLRAAELVGAPARNPPGAHSTCRDGSRS